MPGHSRAGQCGQDQASCNDTTPRRDFERAFGLDELIDRLAHHSRDSATDDTQHNSIRTARLLELHTHHTFGNWLNRHRVRECMVR